jgi:uncharacterized membrane protein YcaP (DUF421 family)
METVLRVAVIYVVLLLAFRVLGKRELASMTPFELVTLMMVPEIVSQGLVGDDYSVTNAIVGAMTIFLLVLTTSAISHRFPRLGAIMHNTPTLLVANGRLLEANMNAERVSAEELYSEMHKAGVARVEDVRWAVLESDGRISVVPARSPQQLVDDAARPAG